MQIICTWGSFKNTFWYFLRKLKKNLVDWAGTPEKIEVIENRRVGRTESYYRLNPEIFVLEKEGKGSA